MKKKTLAKRILTLMGINTRLSAASPEEIQDVLGHTNDWMMAQNGIGKRIGWVINGETPDPEEDSGVPDWAVMGIVNSMAIYLAPYFEKAVHPSWISNASVGMQTISNKTVEIQQVQRPRYFPRGSVNSGPWGNRTYQQENRIVTDGDYFTDSGDDPITTP